MKIKEVGAKSIKDSRGEKTISIIVKTSKGKFVTSAPAGKSKGKSEAKSYKKSLEGDINFINKLKTDNLNKLIDNSGVRSSHLKFYKVIDTKTAFLILKKLERLLKNKIGANSLFVLEASLLKAIAKENNKELWEFLGGKKKLIRPIGNAIGGGLHSKGRKGKKPDFQEFLFIGNGKTIKESVKINERAYKIARKLLKKWMGKRNDEGAWETDLNNERVLMIMEKVKYLLKEKGYAVDIGLDIAGSSFYKNRTYNYKNPSRKLNKNKQIDYIRELINRYNLFYVEDVLDENDFSGFGRLLKKMRGKCLIVGDDLTTTNPTRLMKAIKMKSINAIIVKPNQIGSLVAVKKVIDICNRYKIKTIISHRSGETRDSTIADLGIGFGVDFIKTGIYGAVRRAKLKRLVGIENLIKKEIHLL